jgi:hypothetical protein
MVGSDTSAVHRKINSSSFSEFRIGFGPTLLTACFAFPSTLNMEIVRSSEKSVTFYRIKTFTSQKILLFIITALRALNIMD